ncbi:unnamed protein product [Acanthoscelides obtectus]|uniref:Uncharacterized protein n=1 Tax=Acanthoscelides obtectus TaxID=200917 RepID=A0A9P0PFW9_ACAOB|nr:unnamed protein product [Acanthoscelides obtectus]CAK1623552.1 hypothetical protein AOBTE_LOCUS2067 [Acanthoscelides obtectus]
MYFIFYFLGKYRQIHTIQQFGNTAENFRRDYHSRCLSKLALDQPLIRS